MKGPTITVELKLAPAMHQRLHVAAKARGYTPSVYAQLLFDAAFAARVGIEKAMPAGDADLDEMVRATLAMCGDFSSAAIAKRLGISEALVTRILDGWRGAGKRR